MKNELALIIGDTPITYPLGIQSGGLDKIWSLVRLLISLFLYAAASTLCPENNQGGTEFSKLCDVSKTNINSAVPVIINALLVVAFIAALVFLIVGGIRWILSGGDKEATGKAKGTITAALIGLVIVLAAWILLNIVTTLFGLGSINTLTLPVLFK